MQFMEQFSSFIQKPKFSLYMEAPLGDFFVRECPIVCCTNSFFVIPWSWFLNIYLEKQHLKQHLTFKWHEFPL